MLAYDEVFKEACDFVEDELRKLRITNLKLEYSEGTVISGEKGSSTAISLHEALLKLKGKLNE